MSFRFLSNPADEEIEDLQIYLSKKYEEIQKMIRAADIEKNQLIALKSQYLQAEAKLNASFGKRDVYFSEFRFIKNPVGVNDVDPTDYFEQHRFDGARTATIINKLSIPFQENIKREYDDLFYKIRKINYLVDIKDKEIAYLKETERTLRDKE